MAAALAVTTIGGGATGVLVGVLLGLVARPIINGFWNTALSPIHNVTAFALGSVAAAVVGAVLGFLSLGADRVPRRAPRSRRAPTVSIGMVAAAVFVVAGWGLAQDADSSNQLILAALCFGLAVVSIAPLAFAALARSKPNSFSLRLAMRRTAADRRSTTIAITGSATLLLIAFATTTLIDSSITSINNSTESLIPPGQVQLTPVLKSAAANESLRGEFEKASGLHDPYMLWTATADTGLADGSTFVAESTADVGHLVGGVLTQEQQDILEDGGTLRFHDDGLTQVTFESDDGTTFDTSAISIEGLDPAWSNFDGFILRSTAKKHDVQLVYPTYVYTDLTPEQQDSAVAAGNAIGITASWVKAYQAPDVIAFPLISGAIAAGIALIAGFLLAFVSAGEARALRPTLAGLRALGLSHSWLTTALAWRMLILLVSAAVTAAIGAVIGVGCALLFGHFQFGVSVPWLPLLATILALAAFTFLGTWRASRRIRLNERG